MWRKKRWPPSVLMYSLPLQSSRWFSHKWVSNPTEQIQSICTSLIMLAEEDNTYAKFGAGQNFYTVFPPPPPLHFYCLPSSITAFLLSSLLHHHYISIVFPPPPPLHFYCLPSSSITSFLLSSLLHHQYISIVFPPPSLHFYCLPSSTTSTFLFIGVRAGGGARRAAAPPNFGQLRFFGQREKIWAKPVYKDVSILFNYFKDLDINLKSA